MLINFANFLGNYTKILSKFEKFFNKFSEKLEVVMGKFKINYTDPREVI